MTLPSFNQLQKNPAISNVRTCFQNSSLAFKKLSASLAVEETFLPTLLARRSEEASTSTSVARRLR